MAKYKILSHEFNTFEDVVRWAFDEHKIEFFPDDDKIKAMTEEDLQACVGELETIVKDRE